MRDVTQGSLRLRLLGGFAVERDGRPLTTTWRREQARSLVKMLAMAPGRRMHREEIIDVCWPDVDVDAGRRNLRVTLHAARHALEPELAPRASSAYLHAQGVLVALDPDVTTDLDELAEQVDALGDSDAVEHLEELRSRLRTELLPENRYADWTGPARSRQRRLAGQVVRRLVDAALRDCRPSIAIDVLREELEGDPVDEDLHRLLINTLLETGDQSGAVLQYHRCRDVLAAELGVNPGAQIERLYRAALAAGDSAAIMDSPVDVPSMRSLPQYVPAAPQAGLVGRDAVISDISEATDVPVHVVLGEPGVGRTSVAAAVARRHAAGGGIVVWGTGQPAGFRSACGPWLGLVDDALSRLPPHRRIEALTRYPALAPRTPARPDGARGDDPANDQSRLVSAVTSLLADLGPRPLLIVLDDVHAFDHGSLEILHVVARTAAGRGWRVLATGRDRPGLDEWLTRGLPAVRRIDLMRLGRRDCDELVAGVLGHRPVRGDLDRIFDLSRGNPLFAAELARHGVRRHGLADLAGAGAGDVPGAARDLVAAQLSDVSPLIRDVCQVLACAGPDLAVQDVVELVQRTTSPPPSWESVVDALKTAQAVGLLEEQQTPMPGPAGVRHVFRHPVAALTCAELAGPTRRREIHAACLEVLGRREHPDRARLAWHHAEAGHPRAVDELASAALASAALGANDVAAQLLERAVGLLGRDDPRRHPIALELASAYHALSRYDDASRVLHEVLNRSDGAKDGLLTRATTLLAEVLVGQGRPAEASAALAAQGEPRGVARPHRSRRRVVAALAAFAQGSYVEAEDHARSALNLLGIDGGPCGDTHPAAVAGIAARAWSTRSVSAALSGDLRASQEWAAHALGWARLADDTPTMTTALGQLGELHALAGRLPQALAAARRAMALSEVQGNPTQRAFRHGNMARLHLLTGQWSTAVAHLGEAVAALEPLGDTWCTPYTLVNLGTAQSWAGLVDEAEQTLANGDRLASARGDRQAIVDLRVQRAWLRLRCGDTHGASALVAGLDCDPALLVQAQIALDVGDLGTAEQSARKVLQATDRLLRLDATTLLARVAMATGRADAATMVSRCLRRANAAHYVPGKVAALRVLADTDDSSAAETADRLMNGLETALRSPLLAGAFGPGSGGNGVVTARS